MKEDSQAWDQGRGHSSLSFSATGVPEQMEHQKHLVLAGQPGGLEHRCSWDSQKRHSGCGSIHDASCLHFISSSRTRSPGLVLIDTNP